DECHPASDHFDDVAFVLNCAVNDWFGQASLPGNVGKVRLKRAARGLAARLRLNSARGDSLTKNCGWGEQCAGCTRQRRNNFSTSDHWAGSTAFKNWRDFTFSNFCTIPEGHRISISFAVGSSPRPAITLLSLAER